MSPFYAFITSDMPDPANRVRSPLSASSRNIERPRRNKTYPALRVRNLAFYHLVTQTSRWITWLKDNKCCMRPFYTISVLCQRGPYAPALNFSIMSKNRKTVFSFRVFSGINQAKF